MLNPTLAADIMRLADLYCAPGTDLPVELADNVLSICLEQSDKDRMHELLVKNQADELSDAERIEMQDYREHVARLDLLKSKARLALRQFS